MRYGYNDSIETTSVHNACNNKVHYKLDIFNLSFYDHLLGIKRPMACPYFLLMNVIDELPMYFPTMLIREFS